MSINYINSINSITVTIRKPDTKCTPEVMILSSPDSPPSLSRKEICTYYNVTFEYTFSDISLIYSDNIYDQITKIYNYINMNTRFNVNYGDIIEFDNGTFYFFYLPPILIDV